MTDARSRPTRGHRLKVGAVGAALALGVGCAGGNDAPPVGEASVPESRIFSPRSQEAERAVLQPEGSAIQRMGPAAVPSPAASKEERLVRGARVYASTCAACHQAAGQGVAMAFPPLAGSDYLNADKNRAIATVLFGLTGPVTVNGQQFNSVMPALGMSDDDVANVLTHAYNNWGNLGFDLTPAEVAAVRRGGAPAGSAVSVAP